MATPLASRDDHIRLRAVIISLLVGAVLLGVKFWAYLSTGSNAVLSDALESIVNVVSAGFAIGGILFAGRPADRNHPYGHGKIEFFTAAFEGGLVAFASVVIFAQVVQGFLRRTEIRSVDFGIFLVLVSGVVNAALGWYLIRTGKKYHSLTLIAEGKHVFSDFVTSMGVIVSLLLVRWTGWGWIDSLVAMAVGLNLAWTGGRLVREAAGGLLDEEDRKVMDKLVEAADRASRAGIIRIHHLRAIRAGRFHHVDAHVVLPEFWSFSQAHDASNRFARDLIQEFGSEGEIVFHTDPCRKQYCSICDLPVCALRREAFQLRPALTAEEAAHDDPHPEEEPVFRNVSQD